MSYLRSKDKKCHNKRKASVAPMRGPKRAKSVELDCIMCEHGDVPKTWRKDEKDTHHGWFVKLLRKIGL